MYVCVCVCICIYAYKLLKEKMRYIKILEFFLSKTQFQWDRAKPEVVKGVPPTGSQKSLI